MGEPRRAVKKLRSQCAVCLPTRSSSTLQGIVYLGNVLDTKPRHQCCGHSAHVLLCVGRVVWLLNGLHLKISQHWFYKTLTLKEFCWRLTRRTRYWHPPSSASTARQHAADAARVQFMCVTLRGSQRPDDQILAPLHSAETPIWHAAHALKLASVPLSAAL
jgi:hypothetical protein